MTRVRPLLALLGLALVGGPARADGPDSDVLYQKVVKSCVFIVTKMKEGVASGSGSLIDADQRIVLTNQHVVDENEYVFVMFPMYNKDGSLITNKDKYKALIPENKAIRGKVLHRDHTRDLAFVKLDSLPAGTPALPLVHKSVGVAASTWNVGSPGAVPELFSITQGIVRSVGPQVMNFADGKVVKATVVTATNPANPGDSGGPLVNRYGQQVAVTQSVNLVAQQVNTFIDVTEVRAYMKEQKITIKELVDPETGKTIESGKPAEKPTVEGKKDPEVPVLPPKETVLKTPPAAKVTPAPKAEPPAKIPPPPEDETAAEKRLNYAKNIGSSSQDRYLEILTEIVKKWPGTKAASEAEKIKASLKK